MNYLEPLRVFYGIVKVIEDDIADINISLSDDRQQKINVAEFDEGVFGVEAAAQHYFGVPAAELSGTQAARLAAILPSPKTRSASNPSNYVRKRSRQIRDGAATISKDGRADCFES